MARSTMSLDGALMVVARWYPDTVPRTVRFPFAEIWVRVCGLPFEYLNLHVAHVAGKLLSDHYYVEPFEAISNNTFLRLRVCLKLDEPLVPGFFLAVEGGNLLWVQFKYEEVFKYCIKCGKVGHKVSQCTDSLLNIVSHIDGMLDRVVDRGFLVFQTTDSHTVFNLDLRATPCTTHHISSRFHLGNRRLARERFGPQERERMVLFDLGLTPGGRVRPGMQFSVTAQPFAGPVIFQVGNGAIHMGAAGGRVNVVRENPGDRDVHMEEVNGNSQGNGDQENQQGRGPERQQEEYHSAEEEFGLTQINPNSGRERSGQRANGQRVNHQRLIADPYILIRDQAIPGGAIDTTRRNQNSVQNRVEGNVAWTRAYDDFYGYNQIFEPHQRTNPRENARENEREAQMGAPIFDQYPENDAEEAVVGTWDIMEDADGSRDVMERREVIELSSDSEQEVEGNNINPHSNPLPTFWNLNSSALNQEESSEESEQGDIIVISSDEDEDEKEEEYEENEEQEENEEYGSATEDLYSSGNSSTVMAPEGVIKKEKKLQAGSSRLVTLEELFEMEKKSMEMENGGIFLKKKMEKNVQGKEVGEESKSFYFPSYGISAKLIANMDEGRTPASLSDSLLGLADCYDDGSETRETRKLVLTARKRKCCTEVEEGRVPDEEVSSKEKAYSYLAKMGKNAAWEAIHKLKTKEVGQGPSK